MKVTDSFDASEAHDEKTIYTVELDDGRTVDVMRRHYPAWDSSPLVSVMSPHDEDIDEKAVLAFLKSTHEDFQTYTLVRKHMSAYAPIKEACYSREQAYSLAEQYWQSSASKKSIETLQVFCNGRLVKDILKEKKRAKAR